jgi:regulatory protein
VKPPRAASAQRSLKARALQWLAQREQSRAELRRKLMPHAMAEAANVAATAAAAADEAVASRAVATSESESPAGRVEAVLDWLEAHKYLSNERFAESRVHARSARFGNLRIRQELKQHQVSLSPDAAQALASTELRRAREVLARRFAEAPADAAQRAKRARFLAGRGFSPGIIGRALGGPGRDDDDLESLEAAPD